MWCTHTHMPSIFAACGHNPVADPAHLGYIRVAPLQRETRDILHRNLKEQPVCH